MLLKIKKQFYSIIGRRLEKKHGNLIPDSPAPMEVPSRWIPPHKRARIHWGLYEKDESRLVNKHLDPAIDTVELGCGVGVVSSCICRKLNSDSRYFGLEGNPELVEVANKNIQRFSSNVLRSIEHAVVVGNYQPGRKRKFFITPGNFHISSISGGEEESIEVTVPELSLTQLLQRHDLGDFQLVSDVEGAELEIFQDDAKALQRCRRMIIELHDCKNGSKKMSIPDLVKIIEQLGFQKIVGSGDTFVFDRT